VTIGHSAGFSWDGDTLIFGHEPGGGVQAECEATDDAVKKSYFFHDSNTGAKLGSFSCLATSPRRRTARSTTTTWCHCGTGTTSWSMPATGGVGVVDFNDLANTVEVGWSDPIPTPPGSPFCAPVGCDIGSDWSTYWYNNFIYESSITEGFNVFRFSGPQTAEPCGSGT
jgi:hypothetical protein